MSNETNKTKPVKRIHADPPGEQPSHPAMKANLLMAGVVLLILILAVTSTLGGR
ncbi:MAG: hypothetical protein ABIR32_08790 [Ilumatobacteraceae bacterium]